MRDREELQVIEKDGVEYAILPTSEMLASVGVPVRYQGATLEEARIIAPRAVSWLRSWNHEDAVWATVLTGAIGDGKTHLAAAGMTRFVQMMSCIWIEWQDLVSQVTDSWKTGSETAIMSRLIGTGCLVVDDFGTKGVGADAAPWAKRVAYQLVNGRYNAMRPTIFTSILTLEEMGTEFDEAISSRFAEAKWFKLGGEDRRKRR